MSGAPLYALLLFVYALGLWSGMSINVVRYKWARIFWRIREEPADDVVVEDCTIEGSYWFGNTASDDGRGFEVSGPTESSEP